MNTYAAILSMVLIVILLDVQMQVMNGYETTQAIRKLVKAKAQIPIIAMTANIFPEDVDRCLEAGIDNFSGKPFDLEDLSEKMVVLVKPKTAEDHV